MNWNQRLAPVVALVAVALVASCGKSEKTAEETTTTSTLERIARQATNPTSDTEITQVTEMMKGAGYVKKAYGEFPTEEIGKQGRILVYTDSKGKKSGGVIYMRRAGMDVAPAWHWFFADVVPEDVEKVELNGDGLWDLRVTTKDGTKLEFLQDESFVLSANDRSDWIAMNGTSSPPLDNDNGLWRCFDSDTSTAWRSSDVGGGAFVELAAPFGLEQKTLVLRTLDYDQPRHVTVYADGKNIQEFELEPKAEVQTVPLAGGAKGAQKIRLTFDSVYGDGKIVSLAELSFM